MSTGSSAQAGSRAGAEFRLRTAPLELSTGRGPGRVDRRAGILYGVSVAQAVEALGHGLALDETSLQQIAALGSSTPNGVKCRFSHPGLASDGLGKYLGRVKALRVEPTSLDAPARVVGDLHLSRLVFASPAGDLGSYILDAAEQAPDALGLSVVMDIARVWVGPGGQETPLYDPQTNRKNPPPPGAGPLPVVRPLSLYAVDMVDEPAANRSGLFSIAQVLHPVDGPALAVPETDSLIGDIYPMEETLSTPQVVQNGETSAAEAVPATTPDWSSALARSAARQMIAASGLPAPVQQRLSNQAYQQPAEVEAAIAQARQELAALQEDGVVRLPGQPARLTWQREGIDEIRLALEALVDGSRPPQGVHPLSGLRDLYVRVTGDYDMHGRFDPSRSQFASADSSTMAGMVANALNKRVIDLFNQYPQWWLPAVTVEDFTSLQQVRWVTLGGIGELPTVAEGAAYSEMAWDDQTETASFVKKGGYIGITQEAIDKDDTRRLQTAPRALAQAAWMTLGKSIAAIFTANSGAGPAMSDGNALFHANHSNLGSSALSFTAWSATRTAMQKQTELNSGEALGGLTSPYLLWIPVDLETTAEQVLGSFSDPREGTTTSYNAANPFSIGSSQTEALANARQRIIKVPFWTDTNNWAAQANPLLYPSIGLGFRYGRTPEIFSVASPTAGLMFTNDTLPVKVRFYFAVGPTDWRGLYKHNVA